MKKIILLLNLILFTSISFGASLYIAGGALLAKSATSILFVMMGGINLGYVLGQHTGKTVFAISLVSGLFFSMLGDIVLGIAFIGGAALFAVGHLLYIFSYGKICGFTKADLITGLIIFSGAGGFLLFSPTVHFSSAMLKIACTLYAFIISFMTGKAICNSVRKFCLFTVSIAVGSILFLFSDLMLVFDNFTNAVFPAGVWCIATYYPAQCILAFSVYLSSINNTPNRRQSA